MNESGPSAPAGWYPDKAGTQRYWNGDSWLDIPPPPVTTIDKANIEPTRKPRRKILIVALIVVGLAVVGGAGAWFIADAAQKAEQAASDARAAEREAQAAASAAEAEEAEANREREARAASISGVEASIQTMAEGHVSDGLIDGPVLQVSCSPVGGGSTDDLTQLTTVFSCFVANNDNGDGTFSGYHYNATMNWSTGAYTFGMGAP